MVSISPYVTSALVTSREGSENSVRN